LKSSSIKDLFRLEGMKAIVTGSGGGIGGAISEGLAEFGVDTALFDINPESIGELKHRLEAEFGVKALAVPVDVCSLEQVKEAVKMVHREFRRIDILVNSHGIGQWSHAEEMTEEDWRRMIDVNLTGVFFTCQAVGRIMIRQKSGKIINIASMSGRIANRPQPQAHYNASKAGVIMLTKSLAAEWARYNINVNCISPGYTLTPLVRNLLDQRPRFADTWRKLIPMRRFAEPRDIVGAVIFLASEAASYVTGHDLVVDGGYTIW
jgi:NAD(P)-dependent dehydrogenase (short-subunit alcohol dehydrogenase family)